MSIIPVELPALYLDDLEAPAADAGIFLANTVPEVDSVDASVDTDVQLDLLSTVAAMVDKDNTDVYVNDVLAVDGGVLQSGYDGPNAIVELLAVKPGQLLADGDMEFKGSQLLADGDMEVKGSQLLADGDMEVKGSQLLVDGDMEAAAGSEELTDGDMEAGPGSEKVTDGDMEAADGSEELTDGDMEAGPGSEELADGDMEAVGVGSWPAGPAGDITKETGSPHGGTQSLRIAYNGTANPGAYQTTMVAGKSYRIVGWARGDGTRAPVVYDGTILWTGTSSTSWQAFDVSFVAATTTITLRMLASAGWVEFDDVTLFEPAPDWTTWNAALVTKEIGSPHGGALSLRVTYDGTSNPGAQQPGIVTAGKSYRLRGWARGDGTFAPRVYLGSSEWAWTGTSSTSWQEFDITVRARSTTIFYHSAASAAGWAEFDDLSVKEAAPDWNTGTDSILSKDESDPHEGTRNLRITRDGAGNPSATQLAIVTVDRTYNVSGWARSDGSARPRLYWGGATTIWTGTVGPSWQYFSVNTRATHTGLHLFGITTADGQHVEFDEVSIKDTAPDWTDGNSPVMSKDTTSPHGGLQCLRLAYDGVTSPNASQNILTTGRSYRITGWARGDGTFKPSLVVTTTKWTGTVSTSWQQFDVIVVGGSIVRLYSDCSAAGYVEFDDVSIVETCPDWEPVSNPLATKETTSPQEGVQWLKIAYTDTSFPTVRQTVMTAGKTYRVVGYGKGDGTYAPYVGDGTTVLWTGTSSVSWQAFDVTFVALNTDLRLRSTAAASGYAGFDAVVLTEDCPDWTDGSSALMSKESGAPGGSGSQVFRLSYGGVSYPIASQSVLTVGKTYRVTGWARGDGTYYPRLLNDPSLTIWNGTSSTSWQAIDETFVATGTFLTMKNTATAAGWTEFDDLVITEDCPDWTPTAAALLSKQAGSPGGSGSQVLRVEYTTTGNPQATQSVLTTGKTYRFTGWARGDGTAVPRVLSGDGSVSWIGTSSTSWQAFDVSGKTTSTTFTLRAITAAPGHAEFDDVVVTEDCPDWEAVNSGLMSKESGLPGGSGAQVIRVTYNAVSSPAARQTILTIGKTYRLTGWARGDGTNLVYITDGVAVVWTGTSSSTWQAFDVTFVSTGTKLTLVSNASAAGWGEFDDITVAEVHDLRIVLDPTTDFTSEELVEIRVVSQTVGGSYTIDTTYTFVTEDVVVPTLLSAQATGPFTIRCTFSEDMLAVSATGTNDALNPSLYSFEYQPESDRIAAVAVYPVSVDQVSGAVFDVTVDMEPTFWKTYQAQCGEIADNSSNENILDYNSRTADFASWYPPYWPARRQFDLWSQLSDDDRASDEEIGDLRRFVSALQDVVDVMFWDIDAEQWYHDIDKAPEWAVDAMLADLGNPFTLELTLERKRKLLGVLVEIYQEKGTDEGIVDVARFFLGIEITSVTEINIDTWVLGESELGVDTDLGPSGEAELYTFWLNVDRTLTDQERRDLSALVDYLKPAHTHYLIIEPADPQHVDHVELGLSELGVNWDLH